MARGWHLEARPQGLPRAADFSLREIASPPLRDGQVRVRNRWLSVDPYMRGRMNDVKSYVPPFALGAPLEGGAVGEVVESRAAAVPVGAIVEHMAGWRDEAVLAAAAVQPVAAGVPEQLFLSTLGLPGMTAWFGLLDAAAAKAGDTVFVSAAAGAVGSVVVQLAKAKGMTVIGAAGGPDKCAYVESLGADATIDYKAERSLVRALAKAAPGGIDVYFDNVGGDHLDAALANANDHARFAECGMIDGYNSADPIALRYLMRVVAAKIRLQGFIVMDYLHRASEFQAGMMPLVASGTVTSRETVHDGLDATLGAFLALFEGGNTGKMLVRL